MVISARDGAQVRTHTPDLEQASTGQLAGRLSEQVSRLVRDEIALAKLEAKQKASKLGIGIGMFAASGALVLLATLCGLTAAILGIANVVQAWLAALIVAGALFALAGVLALAGRAGVRRGTPPVPTAAVDNAKADVAAVRQAVRR
jgi:hypothetical protein